MKKFNVGKFESQRLGSFDKYTNPAKVSKKENKFAKLFEKPPLTDGDLAKKLKRENKQVVEEYQKIAKKYGKVGVVSLLIAAKVLSSVSVAEAMPEANNKTWNPDDPMTWGNSFHKDFLKNVDYSKNGAEFIKKQVDLLGGNIELDSINEKEFLQYILYGVGMTLEAFKSHSVERISDYYMDVTLMINDAKNGKVFPAQNSLQLDNTQVLELNGYLLQEGSDYDYGLKMSPDIIGKGTRDIDWTKFKIDGWSLQELKGRSEMKDNIYLYASNGSSKYEVDLLNIDDDEQRIEGEDFFLYIRSVKKLMQFVESETMGKHRIDFDESMIKFSVESNIDGDDACDPSASFHIVSCLPKKNVKLAKALTLAMIMKCEDADPDSRVGFEDDPEITTLANQILLQDDFNSEFDQKINQEDVANYEEQQITKEVVVNEDGVVSSNRMSVEGNVLNVINLDTLSSGKITSIDFSNISYVNPIIVSIDGKEYNKEIFDINDRKEICKSLEEKPDYHLTLPENYYEKQWKEMRLNVVVEPNEGVYEGEEITYKILIKR